MSDSLQPHGLHGSSVHGIFQARILEWVAISFSRGSSWPRDWTQVSHIVGRCFTIWVTREANIGELKLRLSLGRLNLCVEKESEVAQSCPTLWDPLDCSLPGSSIHGIFQARVLEWVAISFSRRSSQPRDRTRVSGIAGRCFTIWATKLSLSESQNLLQELRLRAHRLFVPDPSNQSEADLGAVLRFPAFPTHSLSPGAGWWARWGGPTGKKAAFYRNGPLWMKHSTSPGELGAALGCPRPWSAHLCLGRSAHS